MRNSDKAGIATGKGGQFEVTDISTGGSSLPPSVASKLVDSINNAAGGRMLVLNQNMHTSDNAGQGSGTAGSASGNTTPASPDPDHEPDGNDKQHKNNNQQKPNKEYSQYADRLNGKTQNEAEKILDKELLKNGWIKSSLKRGDGWRYTDRKGNSISINRGYPDRTRPGDAIHENPYLKINPGGIRIPLK